MSTHRIKRLILSVCVACLLALPIAVSSAPIVLAAPGAPLSQCDDTSCH